VETLILKVALAPALVLGVTLATRRWGSQIGGMLIALPVVAGPILLVITLQHGEVFGARAARGALLGVVALSAFCITFAAAAATTPMRWPGVLLAGWAAFAVVAAGGSQWDAPPVAGLASALAALLLARTYFGRIDHTDALSSPPPSWDLYARAGAVAWRHCVGCSRLRVGRSVQTSMSHASDTVPVKPRTAHHSRVRPGPVVKPTM
jgi:hypothetical protein